jgi:hypothetical protein
MFRQVAGQLAKLWADYVRPTPFEAKFPVGAIEVEIKIRQVEPNTKPLRYDEDDRIAD